MTTTFVEVDQPTNPGEKIEVHQVSDGIELVDRQTIILADDTDYAARAKVKNADPAVSDYGLTVREAEDGLSTYHKVAAASNNAAAVKGSAGRVYGWTIFNKSAYPIYLKLYDKATAPNPASDAPKRVFGVQAGTQFEGFRKRGIDFSLGVAIAIVKGIADTDNTAVAANDCVVGLDYI